MKASVSLFALILVIESSLVDALYLNFRSTNASLPLLRLGRRQEKPESTCGYYDGNANAPRTAEPGFNCRVDTFLGLWGFCPNTVINARDCGLAGACVDRNLCKNGCGIPDNPGVTTFTCTAPGGDHCSTARMVAGPDQTFDYIACGATPALDILLDAPTTTKVLPPPVQATPPPAPRPPPVTVTETPPAPVRTEAPEPEEEEEEPSTTPPPRTTALPIADDDEEESSSDEDRNSSAGPTSSSSTVREQSANANKSSTSDLDASETGTTNSTPPSGDSKDDPAPPNNLPAIIGGAVGGFAVLSIVCFGIWYIRHKRSQSPKTIGSDSDKDSLPPGYWQATPKFPEASGNPIYEKDSEGVWHVRDGGHGGGYGGMNGRGRDIRDLPELPGASRWRNTNSAAPFEMPATPLQAPVQARVRDGRETMRSTLGQVRGHRYENGRPIRPSRAWDEGL